MALEDYFPNLVATDCRVTSPASPTYNCVAWAAGDASRWWWPDAMELAYWPESITREESLNSFISLFGTLGFEISEDAGLEAGFEKIALYAKGNQPTHAARQLDSGRWTSKLGPLEDIEHSLDGLAGDCYGSVIYVFRRAK